MVDEAARRVRLGGTRHAGDRGALRAVPLEGVDVGRLLGEFCSAPGQRVRLTSPVEPGVRRVLLGVGQRSVLES